MTTPHSRLAVPESDLTVHLIEDRRSLVSPWGRGNSKIGPGVYAYSKLPGKRKSCPGASKECEAICYAKKVESNKAVWDLWRANTKRGAELPPLPDDATLVRMHVSGDFDSIAYIEAWIALAYSRPEVTFWGYTRSWAVPKLHDTLVRLRDLLNVQLWASVDSSMDRLPGDGWRLAWIEDDERIARISDRLYFDFANAVSCPPGWMAKYETRRAMVCPEETGHKANCTSCKFCFKPGKLDLVFLKH